MTDPSPASAERAGASLDPAHPGAAQSPVSVLVRPGLPIDEYQASFAPRRRIVLPAMLFLTTCVTTFFAGAYHWQPTVLWFDQQALAQLKHHWQDGLLFMAAVMGVLLAHEMGHFLMTVRHRIAASYPYFIPLPIMMTGTMGAVIRMDGFRADRKQVFDIGLAGPLAGLVVAVPLIWLGIATAEPWRLLDPGQTLHFGEPLLVKFLRGLLRPELAAGAIKPNPLYMAGWVGMLITGLNMLPISQLDGGHVSYAVFGRKARWLARTFLLAAIGLVIVEELYNWTLMLVLVTFIGVDHPPTANDRVTLDPARWLIGLASLLIPVLCFPPYVVS